MDVVSFLLFKGRFLNLGVFQFCSFVFYRYCIESEYSKETMYKFIDFVFVKKKSLFGSLGELGLEVKIRFGDDLWVFYYYNQKYLMIVCIFFYFCLGRVIGNRMKERVFLLVFL